MASMSNKIKLFCFPYAGGSSAVYIPWKRFYTASPVDLFPVELSGRGRRIGEPLYQSVDEMIQDAFLQIKDHLKDGNYSFFGHSMGAMICYELCREIRRNGYPLPLHIFFSGRGAPQIDHRDKNYHLMPDDEFRNEVMKLGGTPPEFFTNPELTTFFVPILKNDFRLVTEAPRYTIPEKIDVDISVLVGKDDDLFPEQISGWKEVTSGNAGFYYFNGNHFFLHHAGQEIANIIQRVFDKNFV